MLRKTSINAFFALNAKWIVVLLFNLIFTSSFSQTTRYVMPSSSGNGSGSSWANAFTNFQSAIDASSDGDYVFVAAGTYMPGAGASFSLKRGVKVYGGFAGTESLLSQRNFHTNVTILKGNGGSVIKNYNLDNFSNFVLASYSFSWYDYDHFVPNYSTVLDGFTITGGYVNYSGGGILNVCSSPLYENCIISSNVVTYYGKGGGVYNHASTPKFVNCVIKNNQALSGFDGQGGNYGAGVFNQICSPIFINTLFTGNSAPLGAGGAVAYQSSTNAILPSHYFINCTFSGNSANYGGAFWITGGYLPTKFNNCIIYGNSGTQVYNLTSSLVNANNTLIQGANLSSYGSGNLSSSANPLFVDAANGDFTLKYNSPCINAGSNLVFNAGQTPDVSSVNSDNNNFSRNQGGTVDLGVYELSYYYISDSTLPSISNVFTKDVSSVSLSHVYPGGIIQNYSISPSLPSGLSLNTSTGNITGIPTSLCVATNYTITIVKTESTTTSNINITVVDLPPSSLSYVSPQVLSKGVSVSPINPTVAGGPVVSYSISPSLPAGLTLNTSTGAISGTPTVLSTATTYTVTATNSGGNTTATISITVNDIIPSALSYSTPNAFTNGTTISNLVPSVSGGAVVSYSISPILPSGLSFNTSTGVISGTPSTASPATNYTITAANSGGSTNAVISIAVNEIPPSNLSYTSSNIFNVCIPITALSPSVSGGAAVSYSISPSLPAGLNLNSSSGVITGTPSIASPTTNYTITATNSVGSSSTTITILVNGAPNITYATYGSPLVLTKDQPMNVLSPTNTGGVIQSYSVSPSFPQGINLNNTTGVISGVPTSISSATNYTITATSCAGSSSRVINISVIELAPSNLAYSTPSNFVKDVAIVNLVPSSQGSAVSSYSISPSLPAGLSFNTTTGIISGTPTVLSSATNYTITALNNIGSCSFVISISVVASFQLPSISYGSPKTYYVGQNISPLYPVNSGGSVQGSLSTLASGFPNATGIASDASGNIFVANQLSSTVDLVTSNGAVSLLASYSDVLYPYSVAVDASGSVYINDVGDYSIKRRNTNGSIDIIGSYDPTFISNFFGFSQIEVSAGGTVYLLNWDGDIYKQTGFYDFVRVATPLGSYVTTFKLDANENIYFNDVNSANLYKLAVNGTFSTILVGISGSLNVIGINSQGNIYLWDVATSALLKSDQQGNIIEIGEIPSSSGQLTMDANNVVYSLNNGNIIKYIPGVFSVSPSLPSGLVLNSKTGVISGTPTAVSPATDYVVTIVNAAGTVASTINITVTNVTLPVSWLSFTAQKRGEESLLMWATASEQNTRDFEIQRSADAFSWSSIGVVPAAGNSNNIKNYSFVDGYPSKGNVYNYYRILQRDIDGKFTYSKIVYLKYDHIGEEFLLYPNPASDIITIYISESQDSKLINVAGSIVWSGKLIAGYNKISVSSYPRGIYYLLMNKKLKQIIIQ